MLALAAAGEQPAERAGGAAGRRVLQHAQRRAFGPAPNRGRSGSTGAGARVRRRAAGRPRRLRRPPGRAARRQGWPDGAARRRPGGGPPRRCAAHGRRPRRPSPAGRCSSKRCDRHLGADLEWLRRGDIGAVTVPPSRTTSARTGPAISSKTIVAPTGRPSTEPARASANAVPTLGWPAKGSSATGVRCGRARCEPGPRAARRRSARNS